MVRPDLSPRLAHSCLRRLPLLSLGAIAFLLLALTPASPAHAANFYGVWIQASNFDVPGVPKAELDIAGTPYLLLETQDPTTPLNALLWNPTSTISLAPGPNVDVHLCKGFAGMQTATGVQIFAFGNFEVGGVTTRLIMWDGGSWGFAQGPVLGVIPNQIRVRNTATGPELWLAGPVMSFPGIQGLPSIARFDGTQWSSPGLVNGVVTELAIVDEGLPAGESVYLAGDFATAGGIQTQNVARFDGSWSNLAGGVAGSEPLLSVVEFTPGQPEIWLTVTASPTEQALYRWREGAWDDVTPSLPNGSTGLFGRVASLPTFFGTMVICEKTAFTSEGPRNFGWRPSNGDWGNLPTPAEYAVTFESAAGLFPAGVYDLESPLAPRRWTFEDIRFIRGDANTDSTVDISDAITILTELFPTPQATLPPIRCLESANVNGDNVLDIADAIFLLDALFPSATPPAIPAPFPSCGPDTAPTSIGCHWGTLHCP